MFVALLLFNTFLASWDLNWEPSDCNYIALTYSCLLSHFHCLGVLWIPNQVGNIIHQYFHALLWTIWYFYLVCHIADMIYYYLCYPLAPLLEFSYPYRLHQLLRKGYTSPHVHSAILAYVMYKKWYKQKRMFKKQKQEKSMSSFL